MGWVGGLEMPFFVLLPLHGELVIEKSEILHYYSLHTK